MRFQIINQSGQADQRRSSGMGAARTPPERGRRERVEVKKTLNRRREIRKRCPGGRVRRGKNGTAVNATSTAAGPGKPLHRSEEKFGSQPLASLLMPAKDTALRGHETVLIVTDTPTLRGTMQRFAR